MLAVRGTLWIGIFFISFFFRGSGVFFISFYFLLLRLIELRKKHAEGELPSLSSEQIIGQAIIIIIIIIL